jgi:hypothetical protein
MVSVHVPVWVSVLVMVRESADEIVSVNVMLRVDVAARASVIHNPQMFICVVHTHSHPHPHPTLAIIITITP